MNDNSYALELKELLVNCIEQLVSEKRRFLKNPERDFSRNRKITFEDFINICLQMEGGALQNELLKYFNFSEALPTKSAFCQQRGKVSPEALEYLFCMFTEKLRLSDGLNTFMGYRIIAGDGSDVNTPYNPKDQETFHQSTDKKGYNQLHLNALYDVLNDLYIDCILEPEKKSHERHAFNTMLDRFTSDIRAIIVADRGYESYNVFAHLLCSNQKFIVRLKDDRSNGILSTYNFDYDEKGEFDAGIETILTCKQSKFIKENRDTYTFVPRSHFDFFKDDDPFFLLKLRIVCIEVKPGVFEYLACNLNSKGFPPAVIREIYHLRWNEENSFRDLKYTIDLVHFHSKKREYVEQEAWAKLIVYNFCAAITQHVAAAQNERTASKEKKHDYKINFATAVRICKEFLKHNDGEIHVCQLIGKFLIPIRPNRTAQRKVKPQSAKYFIYRAA